MARATLAAPPSTCSKSRASHSSAWDRPNRVKVGPQHATTCCHIADRNEARSTAQKIVRAARSTLTLECSLATATYSLPAPCWLLTRRVARSTQTIRLPVTCAGRGRCAVTAVHVLCPTATACIRNAYLGVQRARMARLLHPQDALDPGNDLVGGWVGRFVQVDDAVAHVLLGAGKRADARSGSWREAVSTWTGINSSRSRQQEIDGQ